MEMGVPENGGSSSHQSPWEPPRLAVLDYYAHVLLERAAQGRVLLQILDPKKMDMHHIDRLYVFIYIHKYIYIYIHNMYT